MMNNLLPEFPSERFYDFNNGVPIDNETINQWIEECYNRLQENPEMNSTFISSGNTKVTLFRFNEGDHYEYEIDIIQGYYKAFFNE